MKSVLRKKFSAGIVRKKFSGGKFRREWKSLEEFSWKGEWDFTWEKLSTQGFSVETRNFPWSGRQISRHYLKNDKKLNLKQQVFSTENEEQYQNLKRREIIM